MVNSLKESERNILQRTESMQTSLGSPMTKCLRQNTKKMVNLSETIANSIFSWMESVVIFLRMKDYEKENDYLRFVLRLGYLVGRTEGMGNSNVHGLTYAVSRNVEKYKISKCNEGFITN